jgi:hypothetical protein
VRWSTVGYEVADAASCRADSASLILGVGAITYDRSKILSCSFRFLTRVMAFWWRRSRSRLGLCFVTTHP